MKSFYAFIYDILQCSICFDEMKHEETPVCSINSIFVFRIHKTFFNCQQSCVSGTHSIVVVSNSKHAVSDSIQTRQDLNVFGNGCNYCDRKYQFNL